MRLTLRSLARANAPGMQFHLRLHEEHTAAPLLSASHAYMNGPPAKAPRARLLRSAAATSAPSWIEMHQHLRDPQEQFLKHLRWRVSPLNRMQLLRLENEIWDVVNRHLEAAGVGPGPGPCPRPTSHTSGKATPSEAPSSSSSTGQTLEEHNSKVAKRSRRTSPQLAEMPKN